MNPANIYILTPCYQACKTINRTINSVISQSGDFYLSYHIQDGGSNDGTLEIISKWKLALDSQAIPIFCRGIKFTFSSEKDAGLYDAIAKGFKKHVGSNNDWVGWINADDIILPGSLTLLNEIDNQLNENVSWITGTSSVDWFDLPVAWGDRPLNKEIIRRGLCDGIHWSFLQQEGTFFRKKIWDQIDVERDFRPYRFAGDWNLWRRMAVNNEIYQVPWPLGVFARRPGQISAIKKDEYLQEIDKTIERKVRLKSLLDLGEHETYRLMIESRFSDRSLKICRYTLHEEMRKWRSKHLKISDISDEYKVNFLNTKQIVAYDNDWQYPAITEKKAFDLIKNYVLPAGYVYVGFPWATLIDKLQTSSGDTWELLYKLKILRGLIPKKSVAVTVCQHILYNQYIELFKDSEINVLFASHFTNADSLKWGDSLSLKPFALFPVNRVRGDLINYKERKYLYSFIGAKKGERYLSEAREWILSGLKYDPLALIIGRADWHFQRVVYGDQIKAKIPGTTEQVSETAREDQYRTSLSQSVFGLCPSGTGPNTIRLWECIESDVIPVVMSNSFVPPVSRELWDSAVITVQENESEILEIPNRLRELVADDHAMNERFLALRMLKQECGLESFESPILNMLFNKGVRENGIKESLNANPVRSNLLEKLAVYARNKKSLSEFIERRKSFKLSERKS